ncbi:hypothetical protein ACQI4L_16270 [Mycolicibacterium litorale]|uniref:hypothetical protein n=1 Tax=Mycolicibacterium litorale TaxID=758802 RepID=UPI003CF22C98
MTGAAPGTGDAAELFTSAMLQTSRSMSLRNLDAVLPESDRLYFRVREDGVQILACRSAALPRRYRLAIGQFRLAQFVALGWIDMDTLLREAWFCEPGCSIGGSDVHVLVLGADGRLRGYITAVPSGDPGARPLDDPRRWLFPVERVYGHRVIDHIPDPDRYRSDQVWELKRFLHTQTTVMPRQQRLRVSVELFVALFTSLSRLSPPGAWVTGDAEEAVAIRHLRWVSPEIYILEGARPALPSGDLYAPAYRSRQAVKPFLGRVPDGASLTDVLCRLEQAALVYQDGERVRRLLANPAPLQRISA